jgi:hypothetical protein
MKVTSIMVGGPDETIGFPAVAVPTGDGEIAILLNRDHLKYADKAYLAQVRKAGEEGLLPIADERAIEYLRQCMATRVGRASDKKPAEDPYRVAWYNMFYGGRW